MPVVVSNADVAGRMRIEGDDDDHNGGDDDEDYFLPDLGEACTPAVVTGASLGDKLCAIVGGPRMLLRARRTPLEADPATNVARSCGRTPCARPPGFCRSGLKR